MNPIRAHRMKIEAAAQAARSGDDYGGVNDEFREMFHRDKLLLKAERSVTAKEAIKKTLLPKYAPYIEGVLEAGNGKPDPLFSTLLIWRLDAGDIDGALDMAEYALAHGFASPDEHQRTTAEILIEVGIEKLTKDGLLVDHARSTLERIARLTEGESIVDQVAAKLFKARGNAALADQDAGAAVEHFKRALALHPSVGCKPQLKKAEKVLEALAP
ncbi:phage terminase small subunit [Carnimonas bestiolae]|uniref:phage terminase small subunit n=1 Tax=Carnimonas bestiolae TaxID=3402172 RepID=UPI003EDCAE8A